MEFDKLSLAESRKLFAEPQNPRGNPSPLSPPTAPPTPTPYALTHRATALCKDAVMLNALRHVQKALDEGLLDEKEHAAARARILSGNAEAVAFWTEAPDAPLNPSVGKLQDSVDQLMGMLVRDSCLPPSRQDMHPTRSS